MLDLYITEENSMLEGKRQKPEGKGIILNYVLFLISKPLSKNDQVMLVQSGF